MSGLRTSMQPIGTRGKQFDPKQLERIIENALEETAKAIEVDYAVTYQTWTNKPKFTIERKPYERIIATTDKIYGIVSAGSPPHKIRARNAPRLAFQTGHVSKTLPRQIRSRQGQRFGPTVYTTEVNHPGHEGREFEVVVGEKWDKEWPKQLDRAIASELFF